MTEGNSIGRCYEKIVLKAALVNLEKKDFFLTLII